MGAADEGRVWLFPDAGPLITLAYADALDLLLRPGWSLGLVDMVLHEVTRSETPTSDRIAEWARAKEIPIFGSRVYTHHRQALAAAKQVRRKANLGELAIQEVMNTLALELPRPTGIFLFEDHKIARASFFLPDNCCKVSTRAFLIFLENKGLLESAAEVERRAVRRGRQFSQLRFPPDQHRGAGREGGETAFYRFIAPKLCLGVYAGKLCFPT
jgi:hypothetical protein